jgi:hypothetical protein
MIVKTTDDIRGTTGEVKTASWSSFRLHKEDGIGVTAVGMAVASRRVPAWPRSRHVRASQTRRVPPIPEIPVGVVVKA